MSDEKPTGERERLAAFLRIPEYVGILLSALPISMRVYEQMPQPDRSPSLLIEILDERLSPERAPNDELREMLIDYRLEFEAMLKILREADENPHLLIFETPEGSPH